MARLFIVIIIFCTAMTAKAQSPSMPDTVPVPVDTETLFPANTMHPLERPVKSIYCFPEQNTRLGFSHPDWKRMWINTGVLCGCYVASLFVLEMLPEDATNWNRAEFYHVPLWTRWRKHVLKMGPEWDHDNPMFNFVLHPYSGAAYFMAARSCGFSFWGSMLYSACISTIAWEFGIEAFMERPSYQDIFITPLVGSAMGEGFFRVKRYLVANNYCLFGSPVVGNIVAFLVDPVNEVVGLIGGNPARQAAKAHKLEIRSAPIITGRSIGFNLAVTF
ncbi:MAG: DUF3943 domain-containing protein [Muribaculaceae bacterium]|nr:DUF3943 domain-containing protein [Muribaculaceae bacterium]